MQERLQKLIAQAGIGSRRAAEELIIQGRVTINGKVASLGQKADPVADDIRVDGTRLQISSARLYLMINKPMDIVAAVQAQEQEHRRIVRDLIPIEERLYPVGRLDADSEGLVLMTNDGELAQKLTHPRYQHPKVYEVTLRGRISDEALAIWRRGIVLDDGPTQPVEVIVLSRGADLTELRITMREGRKRQIRRIASMLGHPVTQLIRTHIGTLSLGTLNVGEWRYLSENEIKALQAMADSTPRRGHKTSKAKSAPDAASTPSAGEKIQPARDEKVESKDRPRRGGTSRFAPKASSRRSAPRDESTDSADRPYRGRPSRPTGAPGSRSAPK